jgi:hypothetical protein
MVGGSPEVNHTTRRLILKGGVGGSGHSVAAARVHGCNSATSRAALPAFDLAGLLCPARERGHLLTITCIPSCTIESTSALPLRTSHSDSFTALSPHRTNRTGYHRAVLQRVSSGQAWRWRLHGQPAVTTRPPQPAPARSAARPRPAGPGQRGAWPALQASGDVGLGAPPRQPPRQPAKQGERGPCPPPAAAAAIRQFHEPEEPAEPAPSPSPGGGKLSTSPSSSPSLSPLPAAQQPPGARSSPPQQVHRSPAQNQSNSARPSMALIASAAMMVVLLLLGPSSLPCPDSVAQAPMLKRCTASCGPCCTI